MAQKKWRFVEIGVVAYVIYSSIGALIGGVMFVIGGSVMSAMQSSADQQGLNLTAPNVGHVVQAVGVLLILVGIVAGTSCAIYISRHRTSASESLDDESDASGSIDTSHLAGAVLGVAAAEAAHARRRRRLFKGPHAPGLSDGVGDRASDV